VSVLDPLDATAFSGLVYGIYFVLVILGLRARRMRTRTPRSSTGTVLEGAAA
jgi:nicotinamide mononucleotide transporter